LFKSVAENEFLVLDEKNLVLSNLSQGLLFWLLNKNYKINIL
jgi:hypothetical protein